MYWVTGRGGAWEVDGVKGRVEDEDWGENEDRGGDKDWGGDGD